MTDHSANYEYKFYDWKHLDEATMRQLETVTSEHGVRDCLIEKLSLSIYDDPMQVSILADFYFNIFIFCRDNAFSHRKTSSLISIIHEVFSRDAASIEWSNTHAESFAFFNSLFMKHCLDWSPKCIRVFTETDAKLIHTFVLQHYYQNFRLYKYIFAKHLRMKIASKDPNGVETPRSSRQGLQDSVPI